MSTLKLALVGLGSRLGVMAMSVLNVAVLARYLEPRGRGEYFFFLTVVSVLTVLSDGGLSQSVNVFAGRNEQWVPRIHEIMVKVLVIQYLLCLLVGMLVIQLVGDAFFPNFGKSYRWLAALILPMALYANLWNSLMIGAGQIWKMNLVQLIMSMIYLLSTILLVLNLGLNVVQAVMVYAGMLVVQSVIMMLLAPCIFAQTRANDFPSGLAKEIVHFALRGYAGSVSTLLWSRIPVFLLNALHGPLAVGIFSVAQQLVEKLLVPLQAVQDAIFRKTAVRSHEAAIQATNRCMRFGACCMFAVVLVGSIIAPRIISLFFGSAYAASVSVFRVLLVGTGFMGLPMILVPYLLSQRGLPGSLSILAIINALVCFLLGCIFIPRWGGVGAALAIVATQALGTVIVMILYLRLAGTRLVDTIFLTREDIATVLEQLNGALWAKKLKV